MSQTRTRTQVRHAANASIVDMLEERLLETESTNYKHTLRKALRGIRAFREPIVSKAMALEISGVGNHIATQIHIHLLEQPPIPPASNTGGPTMPEPGAMLLPEEPEPQPAPPSRRRPRAARAPRRKEYMPQFRSAPYGIMIALYHAESSGITAMRKDDLARSAQQHVDRPILTQGSDDPNTWYDGWSSVNRTLVSKGLIARGGNPIKFSLSATGRELAERLVEMNNEVMTAGAREYRADRSGTVGVSSLPRPPTTPSPRSATTRPASRNVAGPSQGAPMPSNPSHNLSQEESDIQIAQVLARQVAEEDSVGVVNERVASSRPTGSPSRPTSQARVDLETAAALNRKYNACREFGNVDPDSSQPTEPSRPASRTRRKKLTQAQCDRATKAIHRLEAGGHSRADCIKIVEILHAENAFPRSVDGVYQAVVNALWEIEKQERGLRRSSGAIGLTISTMDSSDDDDDAIFRYQGDKTGGGPTGKGPDHGRIQESLRDSAFRPSSSNRLLQTSNRSPSSDDALLDPPLGPASANAIQLTSSGNPNNEDHSRELAFQPSTSNNFAHFPGHGTNCGDTPQHTASCPSSPDVIASGTELPQKPKREHTPNGDVVVIDLDSDSSPQRPSLPTSNQAKRPRVSDVIAIDSDDEDDILVLPENSTIRQPILNGSDACQNLSRSNGSASNSNPEDSALRGNMYPVASPHPEQMSQGLLQEEEAAMEICANHSVDGDHQGHGSVCKIVLLLDCMERFRNSNTMAGHVSGPGELLVDQGVDCEVRPLPAGDALYIARFPDNTEIVLDYIIERKTIDDYGASMKDGRVARQSYMMRRATIKRRVFLLEGDLKENEDLYGKTELHKKLAEMTMCSGLYVRHTRDIQDTVHFYASLYRRLQKKFANQAKAATRKGRSLFGEWNEKMNILKRTISTSQLFMIQLCQIPGLGTNKAQAIIDMGYKTPFLLYTAYKDLDSREEQDELLNKGELAIGSAASTAVSQLFNQRQYSTIVKRSPCK